MKTADKQPASKDDRGTPARRRRQISYLATSSLTPHPNNVRKHTSAQIRAIAKSIEAFGFAAPILADKDRYILAGNARHLAANSLV